jgi:hypothetical protein
LLDGDERIIEAVEEGELGDLQYGEGMRVEEPATAS